MNNWKVILATIVIFGAGVFTGGFLVDCVNHSPHHKSNHPSPPLADVKPSNGNHDTNHVQSPPRPRSLDMFDRGGEAGKQFMQKLDEALQLTPEQHDTIQKIVADGQRRNNEIWSNAVPQMRQIMNETRQHVRDQLTPDQQKQFEELMKRPPRRPANSTNAVPLLSRTNFPVVSTNAP